MKRAISLIFIISLLSLIFSFGIAENAKESENRQNEDISSFDSRLCGSWTFSYGDGVTVCLRFGKNGTYRDSSGFSAFWCSERTQLTIGQMVFDYWFEVDAFGYDLLILRYNDVSLFLYPEPEAPVGAWQKIEPADEIAILYVDDDETCERGDGRKGVWYMLDGNLVIDFGENPNRFGETAERYFVEVSDEILTLKDWISEQQTAQYTRIVDARPQNESVSEPNGTGIADWYIQAADWHPEYNNADGDEDDFAFDGEEAGVIDWFTESGETWNSRGEHFCYEIEDDHAVLTCYWMEKDKPQPPVIEVPADLGGYPLTAVGWCAFDNWDVNDYPDGRHQAYDGRQVECIVIPEGVTTLENGAFCEAEHVGAIRLPSTLTEIHTGLCFKHVYADISFPNGNDIFRVENGFLIDGSQNALIYCNPDAEEHPLPRVTRVETHALDNYGGKTVLEFPDSVEYIGGYNAYDDVYLETIIVPGSVVEIADHGLYCNSATSIVLHEGLKRIGAFAFSETEAGEIIVPATVEWIGYGAFMWEGLEPVIQNPDCVWETEAQYNSRIWAEESANDEVVWSYDGWPLRTDEIIRDEDGRDFLRVTMKDDSGLMYISTRLPAFASLDEYHCGNTAILLEYPVGLPENATQEDADEAERYFLTFEYIDGDWWLTVATNGWDWIVDVEDGIFRFGDYYEPDPAWQWETESIFDPEDACRLTGFYFNELEDMVAKYNEAMPDRYSLHPEDFE